MSQYKERDADPALDDEEEQSIPLMQKVAIVMVALGEEDSGKIMKHLSDYEIEEITHAIASLKNVNVELMDRVIEEF